MSEPWAIDLKESSKDFLEIVYPQIKDWFGDGELIPVESVTKSDMAKKLDMYSGIDNWHIVTNEGIRGLSSRVQYYKDWSTFTVRLGRITGARTQYAKKLHAIEKDYLYPILSVILVVPLITLKARGILPKTLVLSASAPGLLQTWFSPARKTLVL